MDEHEKALKLLAHQLEDYEGAEEYCATYSRVCAIIYAFNCINGILEPKS